MKPTPAGGALAALSLSMLLASLGTSIVNVGLPTLAQAFDAPFRDVQWVVVAYLLAITILVVGAGRIGDLVGRRRLLVAGILVFTAASLLCGVAPTLALLVAARVAQGLGAAIMMALTLAFVAETVPKARIGSAMGLLGTMSAVGTALGPSLGGLLIAGFGWRAIFLATVPLGILAFALAHRFLPADRRDGKARRSAASSPAGWAAWRDSVPGAGLAMAILVTTVMMTTLVVGPFYLSRALGFDAAAAGLAMSIGPIVAALAGMPSGRLVDRVGTGRAILAGLAAMATGAGLLSLAPASLGIPGYILPMVVVTAGYALFQAANNTAVMSGVAADRRGYVSGLLTLSRNLGLVAGAFGMGAVFAWASGAADVATAPPEAVALGMRITFAVAATLVAAALAIAVATAAPRVALTP